MPASGLDFISAGYALVSFAAFDHVSREQRERCEHVEMVHYLTHAHDDALCLALDGGH